MFRELILEVGCEGGSITLFRERNADEDWRFRVTTDESAIDEALSDEDLVGIERPIVEHSYASSHAEAFVLLDKYRWFEFVPVRVNPEFVDDVLFEVNLQGGLQAENKWRENPQVQEALARGRTSKHECDLRDRSALVRSAPPTATLQLTHRFTRAVDYARQIHIERRKGTQVPYMAHLLGVAALVMGETGHVLFPVTEDMVIAALLHDAAEDHGGRQRLENIRANFGSEVARMVEGCSDGMTEQPADRAEWQTRRLAYLAQLQEEQLDTQLISAADKLYNARTMLEDYRHIGPELRKRFKCGRDKQSWYFYELLKVYSSCGSNRIVEGLGRVVRELIEISENEPTCSEPQEALDERSLCDEKLEAWNSIVPAVAVAKTSNHTASAMKSPPQAAQEWNRFTDDLAICIADLCEDECLIVSKKHANHFVQFAAQGQFGMRAEAASNSCIDAAREKLSSGDYAAMAQMGWNHPTMGRNDIHVPDGSPNFFVELSNPVDFMYLADLAVQSLRRIYLIGHPGELQYKSFNQDVQLRFPTLRIQYER